MIRTRLAFTAIAILSCITLLHAQERTEEWRMERLRKVTTVQAPERSALEAFLYEFKERNVLGRSAAGFKGFHPRLGNLATGSGFAVGPEYQKEHLLGTVNFSGSAQGSLRGYQQYEIGLEVPRIANHDVFVSVDVRQRNFPQEDFYGIGSDSRVADRTDYRLEDTNVTATAGIRPRRWLAAGFSGGLLNTNTGRGTDSLYRSTEEVFSETTAPAVVSQPHYYHAGAFIDVDYRDHRRNPRSGGHYTASVVSFNDHTQQRFSFNQIHVEGQHYFPFFNQRRVIAARALATLNQTSDGQQIPFFMLPYLGGSNTLRGFEEFRFHDRNRVLLNLEYRWEVFSGLDMALFGDAGQVAPRAADLNFNHLKTDYGVGFRFNTERGVFLRVDIGHSNEGLQTFIKFGHVF